MDAKIDRVKVYVYDREWCYSAWIGGEWDHSDTLNAESEDEARAEVAAMFLGATIDREPSEEDARAKVAAMFLMCADDTGPTDADLRGEVRHDD